MSKQQWKILSLLLASLLIACISLLSVPLMSSKLMAQISTVEQCGISESDWIAQGVKNLVERYGIAETDVCQDGTLNYNRPEVRADIADWLSKSLDRTSDLIAASTADLSTTEDLATLERLYNELVAEVEALEKTSQ